MSQKIRIKLKSYDHNLVDKSAEKIDVYKRQAQDMVLGLYYITKLRAGAKGEGLTFYGPEEALTAYNEGKVDIHAPVKVIEMCIRDRLCTGNRNKHLYSIE